MSRRATVATPGPRARRPAAKKAAGSRKDPTGGLTAEGRKHFARTEGAQLHPGLKKKLADMTPEEMRRKGSFLRRHFVNPRGPMVDAKGEPTRLALSAHAWGEPVPKTPTAARKLAEKGSRLLLRYQRSKQG